MQNILPILAVAPIFIIFYLVVSTVLGITFMSVASLNESTWWEIILYGTIALVCFVVIGLIGSGIWISFSWGATQLGWVK